MDINSPLKSIIGVLLIFTKEGNTTKCNRGCTFQVLGVSGSEDRGGGDNSIQFINIGRVGDKSLKEWRRKIGGGGGRAGNNNILTFLCYWLDKKYHFKKQHFGQLWAIRKVS